MRLAGTVVGILSADDHLHRVGRNKFHGLKLKACWRVANAFAACSLHRRINGLQDLIGHVQLRTPFHWKLVKKHEQK